MSRVTPLQYSRGKGAYDWDVYKNRRTALQHLKRNLILVDTIIETEDGRAHELVHSQVMSAFGDKLTEFIAQNGVSIIGLTNNNFGRLPPLHSHHLQPNQQGQSLQQQQELQQPTQATFIASAPNQSGSALKRDQSSYTQSFACYNKCLSNKLKLIRLAKVNKYTLGILVECAYSGYIRTDLGSGGIWQILEVADYYEMPDVIRACCTFLIKNLNQSNCIQFYHIGIKHRHRLQCSAWHQIRVNFKHILGQSLAALNQTPPAISEAARRSVPLQSAETAAVSASTSGTSLSTNIQSYNPQSTNNNLNEAYSHQQLNTNDTITVNSMASIKFEHFEPLLLHDKLNVENEESVWYAIKLWCNHNLSERQHLVTSLLPCMRFPRLRAGTEFSSRQIWRDPLIVNNKQAQHQLAVLDRNHRDFLSSPSRYSAGLNSSLFRDGFNLPCAVNPRQLRPRIPHSVLLAIGGWQQGQPTTLIESYDLNCNLWFESKRRITSPLAYHGIECINGLLYICGGTDGSEILNEMFTFDPIRGDCSQMPSMREARCYVSTSHIDNHLYAMGGHNGGQRMRSVERFDLTAKSWVHVHEMNVARSDASACVYKGVIYIAGGLNDQVIESSVEFYNASDNSWTFITSMITARTSFTLLKYNDTLLAIGGNNGTDRLNSVEQYSFATKLWTPHSQMRHRRSTFSAALVDERKLFVVGGYNGQTPFSQVEMFDEASRQWVQMQKIRYDRSGLKLVVVTDLPNAAEYTFLGSQSASGQYNRSLNAEQSSASNFNDVD